VEIKDSPAVSGMEPVLAEIQQHLQTHPMEWLKSLRKDPDGLARLDQEIHRAFAHMADRMVAGLVAAMADVPGAAKK
jgi:hypothetical protein